MGAAGEGVEHGSASNSNGGPQIVKRADTVLASEEGNSVKVPVRSQDDSVGLRRLPKVEGEVVEDRVCPRAVRGRRLVDCSFKIETATLGCSVNIARRIDRERPISAIPVYIISASELVNHVIDPGPTHAR